MQVWAAIDLLQGSVVTLVQGRADEKTVWADDPIRFADRWQKEGADGLHLIDLDAAFQKGSNKDAIMRIIENAKVPVQVGGGLRDRKTAAEWLEKGAERVVVGTMAYKEPSALAELLLDYGPERVVVAADYKNGSIMTKGWTERESVPLLDAVRQLEKGGVGNILATSVGRDGTGSGPDLEVIRGICTTTRMKVLASGGIRDARDLDELQEAGADGAVLGRALYEGTIRMSDIRGRC
jgi:phosphoribosylformimino-5-aminoimidazole carboxamide ribotide isomerase